MVWVVQFRNPQEAGQCGHHHSEKSKFSEVGQMALDLHHLVGVLHPMNNLLEYWRWRRQGVRYSQCHFTPTLKLLIMIFF